MSRINVDFTAVGDADGRFARLAQLLGLADADHARGKVEHLWVACTTRGEVDLPMWLIERHLGPGGPVALVDAEIAEMAGNLVRISARGWRANTSQRAALEPDRLVTYAISAGDVVKIGRTNRLTRRMATLQTGNHIDLRLLGAVDGDHEDEIHRALDAIGKRVKGEWFSLDADTDAILSTHGFKGAF